MSRRLRAVEALPPVESLGDCILHRTHHVMRGECWRAVIGWCAERGFTPDAYKAAYERAVLNDITNGEDDA